MSTFAEVECAIRQLHARYADSVWRADYDVFGNCFMEDAEWRVGGPDCHDRLGTFSDLH